MKKAKKALRRWAKRAKQAWAWHQAQMNNNGRYARALVQGFVKALWQRTVHRFVAVVVETLIDLYVIVRQDGVDPDFGFAQN